MPKGLRGEKRPGEVIGAAIMVARIATGEVEDNPRRPTRLTTAGAGRRAARRAPPLTPAQRSEIARKAASKRWKA